MTRGGQTAKTTIARVTPLRTAVFALPIVVAAGAILFVRIGLGFQFPIPWPDETGFVAPAFDFARHFSFFDPGLNPDRTVMWMPPGYMVLLACVFRIVGYSFAAARWVSAVACLAALGLAATLAWRASTRWRQVAACWVTAAAFLSPFMLISANIARMEMVFAALILAALMCCTLARLYLAVSLLVLAGLVHFNAVYFLPPLLVMALAAAWRRELDWPSRADRLALAAALIAVGAYAVHVALNWPGFLTDMAFQFTLRRFNGAADAGHVSLVLALAFTLAGFAACRLRLGTPASLPLFGAGFVTMARQGHELWYDYGYALGFALIALGLLAEAPQTRRIWRAVAHAGVLAACAMIPVLDARIDNGLRPLVPSRAALGHAVISPGDIARVRAFIATLPPGATVNFGWTGLELFFLPQLDKAGAHWTTLRHSVTQMLPRRPADWRVVCDSDQWPRALFQFDIDFPRRGVDAPCVIAKQNAAGNGAIPSGLPSTR